MEYGPYRIYQVSPVKYKFYSYGPNGRVEKMVRYKRFWGSPKVYNLAFDDVTNDDEIDDVIITDNKDRDRILATVALTITSFLKSHPGKGIQIEGSTTARTRLYRMAISKHRYNFGSGFYIYGRTRGTWKPFRKGVEYEAFMLGLKNKR